MRYPKNSAQQWNYLKETTWQWDNSTGTTKHWDNTAVTQSNRYVQPDRDNSAVRQIAVMIHYWANQTETIWPRDNSPETFLERENPKRDKVAGRQATKGNSRDQQSSDLNYRKLVFNITESWFTFHPFVLLSNVSTDIQTYMYIHNDQHLYKLQNCFNYWLEGVSEEEPAGKYLTNLETILPAAANTQHTHLAQQIGPTVPGF
jgi:hypothetical protein